VGNFGQTEEETLIQSKNYLRPYLLSFRNIQKHKPLLITTANHVEQTRVFSNTANVSKQTEKKLPLHHYSLETVKML